MDIEAIAAVIEGILLWRVSFCILIHAVLAWFFVFYFPLLNLPQGCCFVLLGMGVGLVWHETSNAATVSRQYNTSHLVAGLFAVLTGLLWGLCSGDSIKSFLVGIVIFLIGACLWFWHACVVRRWLHQNQVLWQVSLAAIAYPAGALIGYYQFY